MNIRIPPDLAARLDVAARRLNRMPEDCALSAIRAFVADCEDAARLAARFSDGTLRAGHDDAMD